MLCQGKDTRSAKQRLWYCFVGFEKKYAGYLLKGTAKCMQILSFKAGSTEKSLQIMLWKTDGLRILTELSHSWDGQTGQYVFQLAWPPASLFGVKCQLGRIWHSHVWMSLGLGSWKSIHHHSNPALTVMIPEHVGKLLVQRLSTS